MSKKEEVHATITTETNSGGIKQSATECESIGGLPPSDCKVGFTQSVTINMGNFESTRIEVRLDLPCPMEDIDEVFELASKWVDNKIETKGAAIVEECNNG